MRVCFLQACSIAGSSPLEPLRLGDMMPRRRVHPMNDSWSLSVSPTPSLMGKLFLGKLTPLHFQVAFAGCEKASVV